MMYLAKAFAGDIVRPDLDAIVSSGVFELCLAIVRAFERAGVEGLSDASPSVLNNALNLIKYLRSHQDCEAKIRGLGSGLAFAMEHSLDEIKAVAATTGAAATQICEPLTHQNVHFSSSIAVRPDFYRTCIRATTGCGVFGRDEGGGDFDFTQHQVDTLCAMRPYYETVSLQLALRLFWICFYRFNGNRIVVS
jgi:hypothetical protein